MKNNEVIYENKISRELLIKMLDIANKYNARCILGGLKTIYTNKIKKVTLVAAEKDFCEGVLTNN